jgi:hypothetical protein
MSYIFIIPLFGIIFNVFYQVGLEGEASYIAKFTLCACTLYLVMVE